MTIVVAARVSSGHCASVNCPICDCVELAATSYRVAGSRACPAFECTRCRALIVDDAAATTPHDRISVRAVLDLRRRVAYANAALTRIA